MRYFSLFVTWWLEEPVEDLLDDDGVELDELGKCGHHLLLGESSEHGDEEAHVRHALVVQVPHTVHQLRRGRGWKPMLNMSGGCHANSFMLW